MESKNSKFLITRLKLIVLILIGMFLYYITTKINLIPKVHNTLVIVSFIILAVCGVLIIYKVYTSKLGNWKKLILVLISIFTALLLGYIIFLVRIFSLKNDQKFQYAGNEYYIVKKGFMYDHYIVYEKDGMLTMKEKQEYREYIPWKMEEITSDEKEALVKGTYKYKKNN